MTQEIRVVYKDSDKSVVGFIGAEITYENKIQPALEKDGVKVASEVISFADDIVITNNLLSVPLINFKYIFSNHIICP